MTARPIPTRRWHSYGTGPLPSGPDSLEEPFAAFPSWFLWITCERCGQQRMLHQVHTPHSDLPIREILDRMRHDGCGGRAGKAELFTGIAGVSSQPVRKIVLRDA